MKKKLLSVFLVLLVVLTSAAPAALADTLKGYITMSTVDGTLHLRKGPGTNTASVGYVHNGDAIRIYTDVTGKDSSGNLWTKIKVNSTGKSGYVRNIFIAFNGQSTGLSVYIGADGGTLNVRKGPGTKYAILGTVKQGDAVTLIKKGSMWSRIQVVKNGLVGYINTEYIKGLYTGSASGNLPSGTYTAGTVTTKYSGSTVHLRSGASLNAGIVGYLSKGAKLRILSTSGEWYRVKTVNGQTGYVSKAYVSSGFTAKTTGMVNLRYGAGTDYSIRKVLKNGASIKVLSVDGKWARVNASGKTGYVHISYLAY